jgi:hypothetical protein
MRNFKLPHIIATRNKINFTTTTKYNANRDENDRLKKNEALFELNPHIKTTSQLANEKSQTPDQLFELLKKNKQESLDNCHSAELSMHEADKLCNKASTLFSKNKSSLGEDKRKEAEYHANLGAVVNSNTNYSTEEEKSILDIDKYLKRLMGAIYRAKSVQDVVPNPHAVNGTVAQAENLITELNTLSHNIKTLTENNDKIRTEFKNRNISLIEDQLTAFMDMPGDFSDVD